MPHRMAIRFLVAMIVAASTFTAPLRLDAQQQDLSTLRDRLDATTFRSLSALIDSARTSGLPTDPLISKAQEGLLKRATPAAILSATRGLLDRLGASRSALGPAASGAELEAAASALRAGAGVAQLSSLRATRGSRGVTVPLVVLADLLARGVPRDTAVLAVQTMAAANATDAAFNALRLNIERDITGGMSPAAAAGMRYRALLERRP